MNVLCVDIGGTKYTLAVFDGERMVERVSSTTDREGGREWMLDALGTEIARLKRTYSLQRCGIGFGGPVNFRAQQVALSTHVGGWTDFDLPGWFRQHCCVPVIMDNDANAGALGEARYGAGRGCDPLFYMTLSTGIGGGVVSGNQLLRGANDYAGEIGHLTVEPGGPECLCGARGCLERKCCGLWLERDYGRPAHHLIADPKFVRGYVIPLARGLKACIMLLNPERIVIGGGISKAGDALFVPLREELGRQITAWSRARIDVVPASLGDDSVLWGALALAEDHL